MRKVCERGPSQSTMTETVGYGVLDGKKKNNLVSLKSIILTYLDLMFPICCFLFKLMCLLSIVTCHAVHIMCITC